MKSKEEKEGLNWDFQAINNHWVTISDQDYTTMQHLFKSKEYHWSFFIGHLVIEKLPKA